MWYISMLSAFTLRDLVDHFAVIRPGYFGQDTSIASTAPAFRESTFFTEGNVCRRCQLCPVVRGAANVCIRRIPRMGPWDSPASQLVVVTLLGPDGSVSRSDGTVSHL